MSKPIGGPNRYLVDADGRLDGIYRDAVDPDTGEIVHPVDIPSYLTEVPFGPPGPGHMWTGTAWAVDPSYEPPVPVKTPHERLDEIVELLESKGVAVAGQLYRRNPK